MQTAIKKDVRDNAARKSYRVDFGNLDDATAQAAQIIGDMERDGCREIAMSVEKHPHGFTVWVDAYKAQEADE